MARAYMPTPCRRCEGPKVGYPDAGRRGRRYCAPCDAIVRAEWMRKRSLCGACSGAWWPECKACAVLRKERGKAAAAKGREKRRANGSGYFRPENAERYWQGRSHAAVQVAIRRGLLPSLKAGEYACTDCGSVAHEYDHRDYGRPLDVEPVCRSCNKQRGTAIWPTAERYAFKRIEAHLTAPQQLDRRALIGRTDVVGADLHHAQHAGDSLYREHVAAHPQQQNDT